MWVSGRHAADLLSCVLPTREHARLVLRAGLAGQPVPTSAALLYDEGLVAELARRPAVTAEELAVRCPRGLYVGRLPRETRIEVAAPWGDREALVRVRPNMPPMSAALLSVRLTVGDGLPWVATLCGYVVLCADALGLHEEGDTVVFDLVEPGGWAAGLEGRRLVTRPGRPWVLLEPGRAGLSDRGGR